MSDLKPAHLNLRPCPYFVAVQENGQIKCAVHVHFLLLAQLGPYVLKLTKCGQEEHGVAGRLRVQLRAGQDSCPLPGSTTNQPSSQPTSQRTN
eukprot:357856-Chlamydomonas_euryale.AAC.2